MVERCKYYYRLKALLLGNGYSAGKVSALGNKKYDVAEEGKKP